MRICLMNWHMDLLWDAGSGSLLCCRLSSDKVIVRDEADTKKLFTTRTEISYISASGLQLNKYGAYAYGLAYAICNVKGDVPAPTKSSKGPGELHTASHAR